MHTLSRLIAIDRNVAHPVWGSDVDTRHHDRSKRKGSTNSAKTLAVAMILLLAALARPGVAHEFTLDIPTSMERNTDFFDIPSVQPPAGGKAVVNADGWLIGWLTTDPLGNTWLVPHVPAGVMTSPPQKVTVYEGGGVFQGELLIGTLTDPASEEHDSALDFYRRWLSEGEALILGREHILQDPSAGQETQQTARAQLADLYEARAYVDNRIKEEEESLRRAEARASQARIETTDEAQGDVSEALADAIDARPGETRRTDDGVYPRGGHLDEQAASPSAHMAYDMENDEVSGGDPDLGDEEPVLSREEIVERLFSELYGQEGLRLLNAMKRQGGKLIIEDLLFRQWDVWQEPDTVIHHVSIDEALSDMEAAELLFKLLLEYPELYTWRLDLTADDLQRLHRRMVTLAAELTSTAFHLGYGMAAGFGGTIVFVANDIETGNVSLGTLMSLLPYLPKGLNTVKILGKNGKVLFKAPGCFVAGTQVLTDHGFTNIEDIRVGDYVWSRQEQTGQSAYKMVTRLFRGHTDRLVHLTYARFQESSPPRTASHGPGAQKARNNAGEASASLADAETQTLRSTLEHPYWVRGRGWVQAIDIRVGDRLLGSRDEEVIVVDHDVRTQEADHYNLEVEGWHSFFVAQREGKVAVWVHNDCWLEVILKGWDDARDGISAYQHRLVAQGISRSQIMDSTVARLVVNGKEYFGVNSTLARELGQSNELIGAYFQRLKQAGVLPPGTPYNHAAQWWTHAEAHALLQAAEDARKAGQSLRGSQIIIYVNRRVCNSCRTGHEAVGYGLEALEKYLGIRLLSFVQLADEPWH